MDWVHLAQDGSSSGFLRELELTLWILKIRRIYLPAKRLLDSQEGFHFMELNLSGI